MKQMNKNNKTEHTLAKSGALQSNQMPSITDIEQKTPEQVVDRTSKELEKYSLKPTEKRKT